MEWGTDIATISALYVILVSAIVFDFHLLFLFYTHDCSQTTVSVSAGA